MKMVYYAWMNICMMFEQKHLTSNAMEMFWNLQDSLCESVRNENR
jgi:hypothetical protein